MACKLGNSKEHGRIYTTDSNVLKASVSDSNQESDLSGDSGMWRSAQNWPCFLSYSGL